VARAVSRSERRRFDVRRHAAAVLIAFAAATSVIGLGAPPVRAECPYLPPWPDITDAIPTARKIIVGEVVTNFELADLHLGPNQGPREYALRVTEVLRGDARSGDLVDMQYLQPNWPQIRFSNSGAPLASCTYLRAEPGEVIALAYDALHPGGRMQNLQYKWVQPPTRYNAVGVIRGPGGNAGTSDYRQPVTLRRLRALAALPQTDTADPASSSPSGSGTSPLLVAALFVLGLGLGMRRFQPQAARGRRVAPGGVRRRES
jgi:hypothetical protein